MSRQSSNFFNIIAKRTRCRENPNFRDKTQWLQWVGSGLAGFGRAEVGKQPSYPPYLDFNALEANI